MSLSIQIAKLEEENARLKKLEYCCKVFIQQQGVHCAETIYQCDWVIENAYKLIEDICDIVGYAPLEE